MFVSPMATSLLLVEKPYRLVVLVVLFLVLGSVAFYPFAIIVILTKPHCLDFAHYCSLAQRTAHRIIFFHDKLNEINIGGIFVVFIGAGLFKAQFQLAKKQKQMEQAKGTYTPVKESLSDYDETESYEDVQDPGMTMDDDDDDHNDDDHLYNIDGNEDSNFKYDDYDGNEEYDLGLEFAPYPTSIKDENGEELRVV